jgi:hypothetical protein
MAGLDAVGSLLPVRQPRAWFHTNRCSNRLSISVMDGLDPAIGYPSQIANDAIQISNHPMKMTGSSPGLTRLDRCFQYVNRDWYHTNRC